jgi:hypothetical protein
MVDQPYAREQMLQFIKAIPPGQRVALFVLGSRLRMISGFTTDSSRRIIKGRPFEVGFECEAELYRKERPYEH